MGEQVERNRNKFSEASRKVAEILERSDKNSKTWRGASLNLSTLLHSEKEQPMGQDPS